MEYFSGLEIEPKKQERKLLFKISIIETLYITTVDIFINLICND